MSLDLTHPYHPTKILLFSRSWFETQQQDCLHPRSDLLTTNHLRGIPNFSRFHHPDKTTQLLKMFKFFVTFHFIFILIFLLSIIELLFFEKTISCQRPEVLSEMNFDSPSFPHFVIFGFGPPPPMSQTLDVKKKWILYSYRITWCQNKSQDA